MALADVDWVAIASAVGTALVTIVTGLGISAKYLLNYLKNRDETYVSLLEKKDLTHADDMRKLIDQYSKERGEDREQIRQLIATLGTERDSDRTSRHSALNAFHELALKIQLNCQEELVEVRKSEDARTLAMIEGFERRNKELVDALVDNKNVVAGAVDRLREIVQADMGSRKTIERNRQKREEHQ